MNSYKIDTFTCEADLLLYSPDVEDFDRLEYSNIAVLNEHILQSILQDNDSIDEPLIFRITNNADFGTYEQFVGVHSFTALNNKIYLPTKIADNLFVSREALVEVSLYIPPKGTFIKLRPKNEEFYEIKDIKDLLENDIQKNYPVLQKYTTIIIKHINNNGLQQDIELEIIDCKPFDIISTNNTDIEVDFEPIIKPPITPSILPAPEPYSSDTNDADFINDCDEEIKDTVPCNAKDKSFIPFCGKGHRLGD